jgi:hypothetical protein
MDMASESCQICGTSIDIFNDEYLVLSSVTPIDDIEAFFCSADCLCEGASRLRDAFEGLKGEA